MKEGYCSMLSTEGCNYMSLKDVTKETAYSAIKKLVERFKENYESYKNQSYNETQTRIDFINPFFKALGWDMDNEQGFAEAYREVIHEDRVKVGEAVKAPDYCFTIQGQKKLFYVEAKKPSVTIKDDLHPAYQVRRYGWSAKLPVSVVTDFEELAVYDTSVKPNPKDNASVARIKYITYDKYLNQDEFDFIWDTFSKEKVLKGSFDKYVKSDAKKRGTSSVDKEFLESLDSWREELAKNITSRNADDGFTEEHINYAVQNILDRIIFLRICEDRGVEPYGKLQKIAEEYTVYQKLIKYFLDADDRYNSGLFRFKKDKNDPKAPVDDITPKLILDDKVLKQIIRELYYPESPYQFSEIPVEILGQAYEQFLGKVIRIMPSGKGCKIEEKPEVRKAGGVYYTPEYIVDYIVKNTVGKLIEGKKPKDIEKIKIVDPACGSGSFLIGAYKYLLNHHLEYYTQAKKQTKEIKNALTPDGRLTTNEKKRILLNNIFGVDIDSQAVEVTKLSLLLKAMEGETEGSIKQQMVLFHERVLPTLDNNIKCGNSLIGHDFYDGTLDLDNETIRRKIKPFDWSNAFAEIFNHGGFDAVIGNPPYIQMSMFSWFSDETKSYLQKNYCSSMGRFNTFGFFIEQGLKITNKNCFLGYIIPNTILSQESYEEIREHILKNTSIEKIVLYENMPFKDAVVEPTTLIMSKKPSSDDQVIQIVCYDKELNPKYANLKQSTFNNNYQKQFNTSTDNKSVAIKSKLYSKCGTVMDDLVFINQGIALKKDRKAYLSDSKKGANYKPVLDGREINRYALNWSGTYLKYDINAIHSCKREDIFNTNEKIIFRRVSSTLIATIDTDKFYTLNTLVVINIKPNVDYGLKYILGIFNSKLLNYFYTQFIKSKKTVFSEIQARQVGQLPIPSIDLKKAEHKDLHDKIVTQVDKITDLQNSFYKTKNALNKQQLQDQIDHTDRKIDELVYKLYGLTSEEIKIIEDSVK